MSSAEPHPLQHRKVLVTRPRTQSGELCRLIAQAGGIAIPFPVIEIAPPQHTDSARASLQASAGDDMVVFISKNAVHGAEQLEPGFLHSITEKQLYAIGPATAAAIEKLGPGTHCRLISGSGQGSEQLLDCPEFRSEQVSGKRILIIRGEGGRELLAATLSRRGADVHYAEVYRRTRPDNGAAMLKKIWHDQTPDAIVITSVEGLSNLFEMTAAADQTTLLTTPLVVFSPRIQAAALELGFEVMPALVHDTSDRGLLQALIEIFERVTHD